MCDALQLPQPSALYHNDCQHLGNQLLSLPYTYAPKLAQLAPSAPAQLVDAAQRLKQAGANILAAQVRILSAVAPLPGSAGHRGVAGVQRKRHCGSFWWCGYGTYFAIAAMTSCWRVQAARQAEEVAGVLAQAGGWRLHQAQRGITVRRVVQQALHALRRLGDVLGGTLAPKDFVRTAAAAVDALAERAAGEPLHTRSHP